MKTAVIVAAGLSSRLYPLTEKMPKCLLPLGDEKIIERNIRILKANGIDNIIIVTGYKKKLIEEVVQGMATTIFNPYYKYCNNMGSLYAAKLLLNNEPFLYVHGDVVYTEELLKNFLATLDRQHTMELAVDFKETDEEAMKVRIDASHKLIESNKEIPLHESAGEWIGLAAIHNPQLVFEYIEEALAVEHLTVYDTYAFSKLAKDGYSLYCQSIEGENWFEIDFIEDYNNAKELFAHD